MGSHQSASDRNAGYAARLRRVFGNAACLAVFRLIADTAFFGFYVLLSRSFGPEAVGAYALGQGTASMLIGIPQFACANYLIHVLGPRPADEARLWASGRRLALIGAAAGAAAVTLPFVLLRPDHVLAVLLTSLSYAFYLLGERYKALAAAREQLQRFAPLELVYKAGGVVLTAPLLLAGAPLEAVLLVLAACGVVYLGLARALVAPLRPAPADADTLAEAARGVLPFLANAAMWVATYRFLPIALVVLAGAEASGLFAAAFKPIETLMVCLAFLRPALVAPLSRLHGTAPVEHLGLLSDVLRWLAVVASAATLAAILAAPWAIPLVYGPAFQASVPVFAILAPLLLLTPLRDVAGAGLASGGSPWSWTSAQAVTLGVAGAATLVLVPVWGASGAATALVTGEAAGALFALRALLRRYPSLSAGLLLRPIAALLAGLSAGALAGGTLGALAAGAAAFGLLLGMMGGVRKTDLRALAVRLLRAW